NPDDIRLGFFGGASQWLGLQVGEGASALFDLSPLGALADQVLEPQKTYLLPDGGKLQTAERVMVAGLAGVEGLYTQADTPGAIIRVVLADDLYIRQFLPFPLRVQLEYEDTTSAGSEEEGTLDRSFSGHIELVEYVHTPSEGNSP
ncbi:hypothetical protein KJ567_04325, partial [Candidatus Bipolaricaulota bacterium]|nr:hypothetical protein [Candidatus Bipolaricaulota bacterium]